MCGVGLRLRWSPIQPYSDYTANNSTHQKLPYFKMFEIITILTVHIFLILFSGLIGFTKSLAKEVASRNIRVNMVAPGFIDTDMTSNLTTQNPEIEHFIPLGRYGKTYEVAEAICFLVETPYITGQVWCFVLRRGSKGLFIWRESAEKWVQE